MARIRLILAYDGTDFSGWQLQPRDRTVQGELERAAASILGHSVRAHGSGRTDAGVHALGQVAHFDVPDERADLPWARALNSLLPRDVRVLEAGPAHPDFHSRYSAVSKTYTYALWHTREYVLPQRRRFVWGCGSLDLENMERAAAHLCGTHDFAAFQNVGTPVKSTVRTISEFGFTHVPGCPETLWRVSADGFLKQMVRNLMGCLVAVGRGRLSPDDVPELLERVDRTLLPATAPPQGLTLEHVEYGGEEGKEAALGGIVE